MHERGQAIGTKFKDIRNISFLQTVVVLSCFSS